MDTFTFAVAVLLMMIAVQYNQLWMMFAIVALMILSMRSFSTTVMLIAAMFILLFGKEYLAEYWPYVLFGLIMLSLIIGGQQKQEPAGYSDMFGGGEMGGMGLGGGF